jgi:hypothetical protein
VTEAQTLSAFLTRLGPEDAARARAAAERIDALERAIELPGWIERNLVRLALAALVLFVIGAGGLFGIFGWGRALFGLGGVTLMVAAFPALMLAYLLSVRGRTRADHEKMTLNVSHFLPHGGLYFGAVDGVGMVVRAQPKSGEKNLREQVQARYDAATKRRW